MQIENNFFKIDIFPIEPVEKKLFHELINISRTTSMDEEVCKINTFLS